MPSISAARREARREERKERILQAAIDSLVEHGYTGTSMRTIAEAAGTTKGALYSYYANKEAILLAVAERYMRRQLGGLAPEEGGTAHERLERLFEAYRRSDADPRTVREQRAILDLWLFAGDLPTVRRALEARYSRYLRSLADLVRQAQEQGEIRKGTPPEHVAGLILAARDGMVFQRVRLGAPVAVPQLTELLHRMVVEGLVPDTSRDTEGRLDATTHQTRSSS